MRLNALKQKPVRCLTRDFVVLSLKSKTATAAKAGLKLPTSFRTLNLKLSTSASDVAEASAKISRVEIHVFLAQKRANTREV